MPKILRVFIWGLIISFLGSLPLGTLNIAAMQISISDGIEQAMLFALGCLMIEMFYVRLSLLGMSWVMKQKKLMRILDWLTLLVMATLATGSFLAAIKGNAAEHGNFLLHGKMHRLLLGMAMSAINPIQIPFWFGWSAVLMERKVLENKNNLYNTYIIGIGIGAFIGYAAFIFGGRAIVENLANSGQYINWVIGGIFSLTALLQLLRILRKKDTFEQIEEKTHHHPTP